MNRHVVHPYVEALSYYHEHRSEIDRQIAELTDVEAGSKLGPPRELVSLRKWRRVSG